MPPGEGIRGRLFDGDEELERWDWFEFEERAQVSLDAESLPRGR